VLLERRPPAGIWGGLWSLPEADTPEALARRMRVNLQELEALPAFKHRLTHMLINIRPQLARSVSRAQGVECCEDLRWFSDEEWPKLGLPQPVLRLLEQNYQGETA
jgi:A/G-specific adenine glycosylase